LGRKGLGPGKLMGLILCFAHTGVDEGDGSHNRWLGGDINLRKTKAVGNEKD